MSFQTDLIYCVVYNGSHLAKAAVFLYNEHGWGPGRDSCAAWTFCLVTAFVFHIKKKRKLFGTT